MLHRDVYEAFNGIFQMGKIETWWQNGYNSIRIRFSNRKEVLFTYHHDTDWRIETIDHFWRHYEEAKNAKNK